MSFDVDFDDPVLATPPSQVVAASVVQTALVYPKSTAAHPAPRGSAPRTSRDLPYSAEAEEYLLSCCLLDGVEMVARCTAGKITPASFYNPSHSIVYACMLSLSRDGKSPDIDVVAQELRSSGNLDKIGGFAFLTQISSRIPTTAQAGYFIDRVRNQAILREIIRASASAIEQAYVGAADASELLEEQQGMFRRIAEGAATAAQTSLIGLPDFSVPKDSDSSVLLGNRYLNRGDGAVLSGTSGIGKSSIAIQMATLFAMGRPAFGIQPNGTLRSLIIQSEDSDGDMAEIWCSLDHVLELAPDRQQEVRERVKILNERVLRGDKFIASLRRTIAEFKPDIVWINPLQAFMDGDVTDSQDLGRFLREGLNGLNPGKFGYFIIHHTTKPATGKDKSERMWHEVMYDMAGGAEIINWARAILSLRAVPEKEGEFNLVLAKRGRRAGVMQEVEHGAGTRLEPITTIPLRHAKGFIPASKLGLKKDLPVIFWEPRAADAKTTSDTKPRPSEKFSFAEFRTAFPEKHEPGKTFKAIHQTVISNGCPVNQSVFYSMLKIFITDGFVSETDIKGQSKTYRLAN